MIDPTRRFRSAGQPLEITVLEFWRWAHSDLIVNSERGVVAEFIVALALGLHDTPRVPWHPFDLETKDGVAVEVKSAAYLQRWQGRGPSKILFSIKPTRAEDPVTAEFAKEAKRQALVYVFAHLHHLDRETLDPLDIDQWSFYVVPTAMLDVRFGNRAAVTLAQLKALTTECSFSELRGAVQRTGLTLGRGAPCT